MIFIITVLKNKHKVSRPMLVAAVLHAEYFLQSPTYRETQKYLASNKRITKKIVCLYASQRFSSTRIIGSLQLELIAFGRKGNFVIV